MKKSGCRFSLMLCFILLITFVVSLRPLGSTPYLLGAVADHIEFEAEEFEENLTIQPNTFRAIEANLQKGEKIEVVFTLQVKEGLPIDV
jgi:hypothetical protein